ncbi:sensor histidine kinase [Rufibacter tibetensis]|uniref:Histidine kinase n=1 Tax=Rufibacter tibetensis TaxID=512763 RepID=A0A0P0CU63_9BACT|nr:histidine kinase [Rufibacter tibetensis]ALJ00157.1 histidine kinase [Rufibacter tibetensis]
MKDLINNPQYLKKIEFWAVTTIFVFAVFFLNTTDPSLLRELFKEANTPFYYYSDYFFPLFFQYTTLFLGFLALNFYIVPNLIKKENLAQNIIFTVMIYLAVGLVFGITYTYAKNYLFARYATEDEVYTMLFKDSFFYAFWLALMFGVYSVVKFAGLYLLSHSEVIQAKYKIITRDALIAFVLWMISMFLLMLADAEGEILIGWAIIIPFGIAFFCYSFYKLLPISIPKKNPFRTYLLWTVLVLALAVIPVGVIALLIARDGDYAAGLSMFNTAFQLLITMPLSWVLYKRQMRGNEEIHVLKKELGQSNANFDFLRSQINPHFLFNALNTIYGTAIQENAERTSEGIEKLGDMMRFMLQENMQEKIPLAREIEYLNNYISFQKLRTDPNPIVKIESSIECTPNTIQISPMLLIPFVENAFKHGISLREPSNINITLEVKDKTLYFDVHNSKHVKQGNDPEKFKSGIGLNNVKQRLQLLYPGKHDLIIRETGKEFFIHLTLKVS